jgi:microcystin-dependent protein
MTNPFIGQITLFAGNFAPRAFAFCEGQLLPISSNTALFSILGTTYGGDGRTTFALPDLRGRVSMQHGRGPGLSSYSLGQRGGLEGVILNILQIPSHSHLTQNNPGADQHVTFSTAPATRQVPQEGDVLAAAETEVSLGTATPVESFGSLSNNVVQGQALSGGSGLILHNTGGNQSHENRRPFLALNYIIAMMGIYPSRS